MKKKNELREGMVTKRPPSLPQNQGLPRKAPMGEVGVITSALWHTKYVFQGFEPAVKGKDAKECSVLKTLPSQTQACKFTRQCVYSNATTILPVGRAAGAPTAASSGKH